CRSGARGSAGISIVVFVGAGGSRGGRLYASPPSSVGTSAASGASAGTIISRVSPTATTCPGRTSTGRVISPPSRAAARLGSYGGPPPSAGPAVRPACPAPAVRSAPQPPAHAPPARHAA